MAVSACGGRHEPPHNPHHVEREGASMKQSRLASFIESWVNIIVGFGISLGAQMLFLPMLGVPINHTQNFIFACIMTVISLCRSFILRRIFEALHIRRPLTPFMQAVIAERYRQIEVEGYDTAHDDGHHSYDLASGGAAYLLDNENYWPWGDGFKRDHPKRRKYVIGAAMALAAGEHLDRNRKRLVTDSRSSEPQRSLDSNQVSA